MLITRKTGRHVDTRRSVTPGNIPKNQCPIAVDERGMVRRTSPNPAKNALRSGNGRYLELHRSQLPSRSTLKPERHDKMNLAAARLDLVLRKSARVPATDDQEPARINHLPLGLRPGFIFRAKRSSLQHGCRATYCQRTAGVLWLEAERVFPLGCRLLEEQAYLKSSAPSRG